jgi:hypothetical protein
MPRVQKNSAPAKPQPRPSPAAPADDLRLDGEYNPKLDDGVEGARAPKLGPRAPALLRYHPERWGVIEGQVVPICAHVHLRAGVHRVRQRKDGTFLRREAEADWEERGWRIIPHDVDGRSYLRELAPGHYGTRWEQAHAGSTRVTSDTAGYARWLRSLIASGKVDRPQPYVLEALAAKFRHEVGDLSDRVRAIPSLQPLLDRARADLAAVEAEIDATSAPAAPAREVDLDRLTSDEAEPDDREEA